MTRNPEAIALGFGAVSAALWSQREALELVLFKLVQERFVLTSGSTRWLGRADAEVRAAIGRLQGGEVIRAAEADALALTVGIPAGASLAELADAAPEPWHLVLTEHRTVLREVVREIEAVAAENRRLLKVGAGAIRETLDGLSRSISTYDGKGAAVSSHRGPILLDEQA